MSLTQIINYDNPSNFTYDHALIDIIANATLKNIRPANSTFFNGFRVGFNGQYGNGVLTGTPVGAPSVSGNQLNLSGGVNYVDYAALGNADSAQTGTIRFNYIPTYSGIPGNYQVPIAICQSTGSLVNLVEIFHELGTGNIKVNLYDQTGASMGIATFGVFLPVSGTSYEFEFDYDLTAGVNRFFIDGIQSGVTNNSIGTRNPATIGLLRLGTDWSISYPAVFNVTNVIIFNTVQHTANFPLEIPRAPETTYSVEDPSIIVGSSITTDSLLGFSESSIKPSNTDIKYYLLINNAAMYFTGGAWVSSDTTFAQTNTAAQIDTNKALLNLSAGSTFKPVALLNTTTGDATPTLTSVTINYDFVAPTPTQPNECIVDCFLEDIIGNTAVVGAKLTAQLLHAIVINGIVILPSKQEVSFNNQGYAQISLISTDIVVPPALYQFSITFGQTTVDFVPVAVPTLDDVSLLSITGIDSHS